MGELMDGDVLEAAFKKVRFATPLAEEKRTGGEEAADSARRLATTATACDNLESRMNEKIEELQRLREARQALNNLRAQIETYGPARQEDGPQCPQGHPLRREAATD